jgi:23S rRNA (pseudouridine1915-N3)-methyltransferase
MKLRIVLVGRTKQAFVKPAIEEYRNRCKRYVQLEELVLNEGKGDVDKMMQQEEASILKAISSSDRTIVLDERGTEFSTVELAGIWQDIQLGGFKEVSIVVGGAYGLSDKVRQKADIVLALSKLTFPHQFVRAILYEQLYRVFTVLKNEPYHH